MNTKGNTDQIVIYQSADGKANIDVRLEEETVWLDAHRMAVLFGRDRSAIVKHIRNIYTTKELDRESTCAKIAQVAKDGKMREMDIYNLDVIIAVGYRVNSKRGTQFRIWATNVLRDHLLKGYTVNKKALERSTANIAEMQKTISLITSVRNKMLSTDEAQGLFTVIKQYADTWTTLEAYDSGKLRKRTSSKKSLLLSYDEVRSGLDQLKRELIRKGEASDLFAAEHGHGLKQLLGAVFQTFGGKELYPSIEEKAAHLLYFIIKDHPFSDGNKRSGSFVLLTFLRKNKSLVRKNGEGKISDTALTALALLVAESKPNEKDRMIALITHLLKD